MITEKGEDWMIAAQVQIDRLEQYVRSVCMYSEVETFLTLLDEDGNILKEAEQLNTFADLGRASSNFFGIPIEIEDEDFYISGTVACKDTARSSPTILLIRIPIQANILERSLGIFSKCVLDVRNERKYKPAADRERLTDEAQIQLLEKIKTRLGEGLGPELDIENLDDFRNSACSGFYYRDIHDATLGEFYKPSTQTKEISEIINFQVKRNGDSETVKLGNLIQQSKNVFFCKSVAKEYEHVLQKEHEDATVFKFASRWQGRNCEDDLRLLRKYGVRTDIEIEFQRIKAKLGREWKTGLAPEPHAEPSAPYYITTHESWVVSVERYGSTYHYLSQRANSEYRTSWLDADKVIFIQNELAKYLDILAEVNCSYKLTKANPKKILDALTLEQFIERARDKQALTSKGRMSFKEITDKGAPLEILVYDDPRLSEAYKPDSRIFVAFGADEAFELAVFCTYRGTPCRVLQVVSKEEFHKVVGRSRSSYFSKSWEGGESYEPDKMCIANCAFHVAAALRNKDLAEMYLSAMEGESNVAKAREYRDFVLFLRNSA